MKHVRVTPLIVIPFLLCAAATVAPAQTASAKPASSPAALKLPAAAAKDAAAIDQLFRAATRPGEPGAAVIVIRKGHVLHR